MNLILYEFSLFIIVIGPHRNLVEDSRLKKPDKKPSLPSASIQGLEGEEQEQLHPLIGRYADIMRPRKASFTHGQALNSGEGASR